MPSAPLLDLDALLAPIPGEHPAGQSLSFENRDKLEQARKEEDPADYAPDDPRRPEKLVKADWPGIVKLATTILTKETKDLLVAARLTEALTKTQGFRGLRDGLHLLRALIEQAWDRVFPELDDPPDLEVRATPFNWLDDPDRGASFPVTIKAVPMVADDSAEYSWLQWQSQKTPEAREAFDKAIRITPHERTQANLEALTQAQEELRGLGQALTARMGPAAPGLTRLKEAIDGCQLLARQINERSAPPAETAEAEGTAPPPGSPAASARVAATRDQIYRQLAQAAETLQRLEPHSPVPYLIQRAVGFGALPFPELVKALIRDNNVLAELTRELGLPAEPPPGSTS